MRKHDMTVLELFGLLVLNALLFLPRLEVISTPLGYFDDAMGLVCALVLVYTLCKKGNHLGKRFSAMLILLGVVIALGIFGNVLYGYNSSIFYICVDIVSCTKFMFVYMAFSLTMKNTRHFVGYFAVEAKILLMLMFVLMVLNTAGLIDMTYEVRYGIRAFKFIFIHPTHMVTVTICCLVACISSKVKHETVYVLIGVILMMSSLRSRWMALGIVILILYIGFRSKDRFSLKGFIAVLTVSLIVGNAQIQTYYGDGASTARNKLTTTSLKIMQSHMPWGTGFGTYGSGVTKKQCYSSLYHQYGFDSIFGLSSADPRYLTDTFFPVIFAQFGVIGLFAWVAILILLCVDMYIRAKESEKLLTGLIAIATLVISTTASGAIFSVQMIAIAFILLACLNSEKSE